MARLRALTSTPSEPPRRAPHLTRHLRRAHAAAGSAEKAQVVLHKALGDAVAADAILRQAATLAGRMGMRPDIAAYGKRRPTHYTPLAVTRRRVQKTPPQRRSSLRCVRWSIKVSTVAARFCCLSMEPSA